MSRSEMFTLEQALEFLPQARLVGDAHTQVQRVHTDTRTLQAGDLFIALKGEHFNANDFLYQAQEKGAAGAIAHHGLAQAGLSGLEVPDTQQALTQLASAWRARLTLPLIAVTGSNGKTTVTQMLACILRIHKGDAALATQGNYNNDIGVPLTLLRLRATHQIAVVELGMNHAGEIAKLAALAQPTVALVNNAQREHQEFMAGVQAVAEENGQVIQALGPQGVAVFPADDAHTNVWKTLAGQRPTLTFASDAVTADLELQSMQWVSGTWQVRVRTPLGPLQFKLNQAGQHNVKNALAAAACALATGVPLTTIATGLEQFCPVKGRSLSMNLQVGGRIITVIDDSYNANPDSMRAAIDTLALLPGPHMLIAGDMGEVGDQGPQFHHEVCAYAQERGIEHLLCLGPLMGEGCVAFAGAQHYASIEPLIAAACQLLPVQASVLVKGSRFMKMERVVQALDAHTKESTCC